MIEIYRDFELLALAPVYSEFVWTRRFASAGEFRIETHFTPELFQELAEGNIIYKRDVDEAAIIEQRVVVQTIHDELKLIATGRHLSSILDRRIFSFEGEIELGALLQNIVNNNFMAASGVNRSMVGDGLVFTPGSLPSTIISAEYRRQNAYNVITTLCAENDLGVKVRYNIDNRTFDLAFLQPQETDTVFSKEFANVLEQDYRQDTTGYRNVVLVEDQYIHNNTLFGGMARREMTIGMPREGQAHFTQSARDALYENRAVRSLTSTVNPHSEQFVYLQDWDIGSIVTSQSDQLGFSERAIVSEIVEIYGEEGFSLVVNIGDN